MRLKLQLAGLWPYMAVLAIMVPLDQFSKLWIRTNFVLGESRPAEGFFRLSYFHNTGASFGMFQDGAVFFTIVSTISFLAVLALMLFGRQYIKPLDTLSGKLATGLVSAGALGNLIDRFNLGYVVDFIDFSFWPAFNVADSCIVVGSIWLGYIILVNYARGEPVGGGKPKA